MKKSSEKKKVTLEHISKSIDYLAIASKTEFDRVNTKLDQMVTKYDFNEFKKQIETTLFNIDGKLHTVDQRLDVIEKALGPLVYASAGMQRIMREYGTRIDRLEHKVGIKK